MRELSLAGSNLPLIPSYPSRALPPMSTSQNSTIQLLFEPTLKLSDEVIDGVIQLHFPSLIEDKIEEVHVKLRGSVYT